MKKKHVYIIGSKGIPAKYGGFETFVEKLTEKQIDQKIQYHVACMSDNSIKSGITEKHFIHNNADCFNISVPDIGPAKAIYYDVASLNYAIEMAERNRDIEPIFYILACRIGPFIANIKKKIKKINGKLFVNPDGHEWLRTKWSFPVRKYWKYSERRMIKYADLVVCDSKNIEKYVKNDYNKYKPNTTFIAYGSDTSKSSLQDDDIKLNNWYFKKQIKSKEYYLVVGRFVPENNYEAMINEFMKSGTKKDFVLITETEGYSYYNKLKKNTNFDNDNRVKFVGTVYDQELLKKIRENAYGYLHGHEVGGTNPSLLESLSSTDLNLLLDVGFNREVGENGALYWTKSHNSLAKLIELADNMEHDEIESIGKLAKNRIVEKYNWNLIVNNYEKTFL